MNHDDDFLDPNLPEHDFLHHPDEHDHSHSMLGELAHFGDCEHHDQHLMGPGYRDVVGTPEHDAHCWEPQTTDFSCAVEAQRGIIEAFGEHVSEAQLCTEAAERGWLSSDGGTTVEDTGKLLELHGIATHHDMDASIGDILQELAEGHKVIVGVHAETLWNENNPFGDFGASGSGANHAIWVTGIDKTDPQDVKIIVNDSGDPNGAGKEYHLNQFVDAWQDSGYYYLATDQAPPNLPTLTPDFDPAQGAFPDMLGWISDHMPDGQSLLVDMMLVTGAMDVAGRVRAFRRQPASTTARGFNASPATPTGQQNRPTESPKVVADDLSPKTAAPTQSTPKHQATPSAPHAGPSAAKPVPSAEEPAKPDATYEAINNTILNNQAHRKTYAAQKAKDAEIDSAQTLKAKRNEAEPVKANVIPLKRRNQP